MKVFKSYVYLALMLSSLGLFTACINDSELDFPEDRKDEITSSVEVFTLLNYFDQQHKMAACFSVVFPIELAYNSGIIITVEDLTGLEEVIDNQTELLYIKGIILPVLVNKQGVLSSIASGDDLKNLIDDCEIPELYKILNDFKSQCFEFVYPVTLVAPGDTVVIENNDQYDAYKDIRGKDYAFGLKFPVTVEVFSTNENINVLSYFQLLQLFNDCVSCREGEITIDPEFNGRYVFKAAYDHTDLTITSKWFLNDELIGEKDSINIELPNGQYEICLKSFHADCVEGTVVCRSFTVNRPCPTLFFNQEKSIDNPRLYYFYADFDLKDDISYGWVVYKNNEFLYFEEESPGLGDNKLTFEFAPGSYTVCLEKENVNENCQLAQYCKEIFIQ